MSPGAKTTVPCALPSFGKVCSSPTPQWSKRPGLVGHAVLAHHRVLAAAVGEVGAGRARDADLACVFWYSDCACSTASFRPGGDCS